MASILIIDDELTFAKNAAKFLEKSNHDVSVAGTASAGLKSFESAPSDLVVLDYKLPDMDGLSLISRIREADPAVPIIMITGHGSIQLAVDAMKAGANDLMTKPVALGELRQRITMLSQKARETTRLHYFEERERTLGSLNDILGKSRAIHDLKDKLQRIASVDAAGTMPPVLIQGETGTGKELIARACHYCGALRDMPFIEVNCAAIPANLLESELLGHERGAFTDAKERKLGLLEAADGGTIFLDEIGEMDIALQAKLLKVIEDGRLRRLGSIHEKHVNVRIVAATNQNLEEKIRQGLFRSDLYFRLRVLQLNVPPLRERDGDGLLLANAFLNEFAHRYRKGPLALSRDAELAVQYYPWPGNVRELRNVMEQAVLLAQSDVITPADLMLPNVALNATLPAPSPGDWKGESALDRVEREMLQNALASANGNVSQAARMLGISRDTLRYRIEKHSIIDSATS